jgi:hypothetical protein
MAMTTKKNESPSERLQKTGLTVEQLREVVAGQSRPEFIHRVREAGLSMSELKEIIHQSSDTNTGSGSIGTSPQAIDGATQAGGIAPKD